MAVEAMLISAIALDNSNPISNILHRHNTKYSSDNHASSLSRARNDSGRKLQRYNSNLTSTTASSNYHTSTFPSLIATLQTNTNKFQQRNQFGSRSSKPPQSRPVTTAKMWRRSGSENDPNNNAGALQTFDPHDVHPYSQPRYRFIWSSINGVKQDTKIENGDLANVIKPATKSERFPQDHLHNNKIADHKKLEVNFEDNKDVLNGTPTQRHAAVSKQSEKASKFSHKPKDNKLSLQRISLATSRSEGMRFLSLAHFNVTTPNKNRPRYISVNNHLSNLSNNRRLLLLTAKNSLKQDVKDANKLPKRPWTVAKRVSRSSPVVLQQQSLDTTKTLNATSKTTNCNLPHRPLSQSKRTSTRPKTAHVRFSEVVTEQKSLDISNSTERKSSDLIQLTETSKPKWISTLSNDNFNLENKANSSASKSDHNDVKVADETTDEVTSSEKLHTNSQESENQPNETVLKLSIDQLRLRDKHDRTRTIDFLSTDQLLIRESIEKVQKWLRTLPKHFDKIHQVSSPTQHDY